ncbi:MAG TPA: hypothetical protein VGM08_03930 [Candidatus Saccharimonadales bacterium]|jgi:hypothetical protein
MALPVETYAGPPPEAIFITHDAVQRLRSCLKAYQTPESAALQQLLENDEPAIGIPEGVQLTNERLGPIISELSFARKQQYIEAIPERYKAEAATVDAAVRSPRSLAARMKKENREVQESVLRSRLIAAREGAVDESKDRLVAAIEADTTHEEPVSEKTIIDSLQTLLEDTQGQLASSVLTLERASGSRLRHIGRTFLTELTARPSQSCGTEETTTHILRLTELIKDPVKFAEMNATCVAHGRVPALDESYAGLTRAALAVLPDEIEAAYKRVISTVMLATELVQTSPPATTPEVELTEQTAPEPEATRQVDQKAEVIEQVGPHEEILGSVEGHFPWETSEPVEISLFTMNGSSILFADAMQPADKALSLKVRKHDPRGEFDAGLRKIRLIELSGNATSHSQIRIAERDGFHGLTMCSLRYTGRNARRTYYIRTRLGQFSGIMTQLNDSRISADTPLMLLMAETDKHNQIKTLFHFGMPLRGARHSGAGST